MYLNNAATSYPKPPEVLEAVLKTLSNPPLEPGRTVTDSDPLAECRRGIANLFSVPDPRRVILVPSATCGLNMVINGLLRRREGGHALSSCLEHNSVLRPLEHLRAEQGLEITLLEPGSEGILLPEAVEAALRPNTRLLVFTHASNVIGTVQPVEAIAEIAHRRGIPFLLDASQSAGAIPLDYGALPGRVFLVAAGHKGLFGPMGTGLLVVPDAKLPPFMVGGTGVQSENSLQPMELPLRYEAGTLNLPGFAGLAAGVRYVCHHGVVKLGEHRHRLIAQVRVTFAEFPGIRVFPLSLADGRAGVLAFNLEGWAPGELGYILHESFGIELRTGLHCAPLAARWLNAWPNGTLRASVSAFNTPHEIEFLVHALTTLGSHASSR